MITCSYLWATHRCVACHRNQCFQTNTMPLSSARAKHLKPCWLSAAGAGPSRLDCCLSKITEQLMKLKIKEGLQGEGSTSMDTSKSLPNPCSKSQNEEFQRSPSCFKYYFLGSIKASHMLLTMLRHRPTFLSIYILLTDFSIHSNTQHTDYWRRKLSSNFVFAVFLQLCRCSSNSSFNCLPFSQALLSLPIDRLVS